MKKKSWQRLQSSMELNGNRKVLMRNIWMSITSRKKNGKCIQLIKRLLSESQKPWNMTQSPLYYRYEDTAQGKAFSGLGKNFVRELYSEIENKKEYEFLRGNKELESIFEEHLK